MGRCMGSEAVQEFPDHDQQVAACMTQWRAGPKAAGGPERKTYSVRPELKADGPEGSFRAVFSTLNAIDKQGDVTLPGAFGSQEVRMQPHGHDTFALTIGKGTIREDGEQAVFEGQLNLEMAAGRETWQSLKFDVANGTPLQEWSYTFEVIDAEMGMFAGQDVRILKALRVFSVDPVFIGAGVGTATLAVKSADTMAANLLTKSGSLSAALTELQAAAKLSDQEFLQALNEAARALREKLQNEPEALLRKAQLDLAAIGTR